MLTVVGSLLIDIAMRMGRLAQPGEVQHAQDMHAALGGKGANQAVAAVRMGAEVALIGIVGEDILGEAILAALAATGVNTRGVLRRAGMSSGCFVLAWDAQERSQILVSNGINAALTVDDVTAHADLLRASQAVVAQLEVAPQAVACALQIAHAASVLTVLNPAPVARLQTSLLALCDYVIVNEHEAASIGGTPVRDGADADVVARQIKAQGARNVLVTLGAQGVWVDAEGWQGHIRGYAVDTVDTIGAGDTFIGAFVARLCEGADAPTAARFATAAAAIAVSRSGALPAIPARGEVEALLRAGSTG